MPSRIRNATERERAFDGHPNRARGEQVAHGGQVIRGFDRHEGDGFGAHEPSLFYLTRKPARTLSTIQTITATSQIEPPYSLPMIIEAGYDLMELFAPKLFVKRGSKRRTNTWVIAMDENLRHLHLTEVGGDASNPIEERIPQIEKALNKHKLRPVVYYALAHLDTNLHDDCDAEFDHLDETLRLAPELIEYLNLGIYLSNGKDVYSSGPRYSFRDYIGYEHLPRNAIILGPHECPCSCQACTQHDEMLRRNWEKHHGGDSEKS